ncbi:MAG: ATP-binding protein [Myxococcaceae bacterium]|nr:ATP-binding protein [Myxococcaceae bacterium]MBH2006845.1 ATP-binding protein [Myxococcaceae bacterium]
MDDSIEKRYLTDFLQSLALQRGKMAFLPGPRQAGKTTLAKNLLKSFGQGQYYT